jgi:uncharacterized membrane protein YhaH (DUF805 family)
MPLRRYFDFAGRSRRKEVWVFFLLQTIAALLLAFWVFRALVEIGRQGEAGHPVETFATIIGPGFLLFGLFCLATFVPSLALQVRRFHDQDLSGLLVLLNLLPFVGGLIVLAFMCIRGTEGPNRFGPDPLASSTAGLGGTD